MIKRIFNAISIALFLHILVGIFLGPEIGPMKASFFTEFGFLLTSCVVFTELTFLAQ